MRHKIYGLEFRSTGELMCQLTIKHPTDSTLKQSAMIANSHGGPIWTTTNKEYAEYTKKGNVEVFFELDYHPIDKMPDNFFTNVNLKDADWELLQGKMPFALMVDERTNSIKEKQAELRVVEILTKPV